MMKIEDWDREPLEAFERFVSTPAFVATGGYRRQDGGLPDPISEQSAKTYTFMFRKFAAWMEDRRFRMSTVSSAALLDFLNLSGEDGTRDLQSKIAYRYLRLLERCYMHLQVFPNPARNAVFDGFREKQADQPMIALTPEQRALFVAALPEGRTWKRRRDRAMQMTMLYGGPRVSEIIGLLVSEVATQPELDGSIKIVLTPEEKNPSSYEHTTWLQKEGAEELVSWLAERKRLKIPGLLAFPANDEGEPLNKATVYRQVKATFARANIDVKRAGGRTLRNTFAVQQLEAGATTENLVECLGLALERSTETYQEAQRRLSEKK